MAEVVLLRVRLGGIGTVHLSETRGFCKGSLKPLRVPLRVPLRIPVRSSTKVSLRVSVRVRLRRVFRTIIPWLLGMDLHDSPF